MPLDDAVVPDLRKRSRSKSPERIFLSSFNLNGALYYDGQFPCREIARGSQGILLNTFEERCVCVARQCAVKKYPVSISRQGEVCTLNEDVNYYRDVIRNYTTYTALRDNTKRELKYTQLVAHPNIVGFYGFLQKTVNGRAGSMDLYMGIIMEFMEGGSIEKMMEKDPSHFTEKNIVHYALGIARALTSCHEDFSIIHRDVKPSNVLLTSDIGGMRTAKPSDFGYARKNENNQGMMTSNKGNIIYMAPEMIQNNGVYNLVQYGFKADVWSFVMFVYFMAFRRTPFEAAEVYSKNYSHQDWPKRDDGSDVHSYYFKSEILTIIKNGWESNPKDRPDMLHIMRHLIMMATDGNLQDN